MRLKTWNPFSYWKMNTSRTQQNNRCTISGPTCFITSTRIFSPTCVLCYHYNLLILTGHLRLSYRPHPPWFISGSPPLLLLLPSSFSHLYAFISPRRLHTQSNNLSSPSLPLENVFSIPSHQFLSSEKKLQPYHTEGPIQLPCNLSPNPSVSL